MKLKDLLKADPFPGIINFREKFYIYECILKFDIDSVIEFAFDHPEKYNEIYDLIPFTCQEILLINKLCN